MEKELRKIFLTDLRFEYNIYLIIKHQKWLSFDCLFSKLDCDDEAKIAKELRKISELEVSEDGRAVTMELPRFNLDQNTLYVGIDNQIDLQEFNQFGNVSQTWIHSSNKFAFITFTSAADQIMDKLPPPVLEKVMPKIEWNKKTEEYYLLSISKVEKHAVPFSIQYQKGIVGYFENVHSETNSKILRQLFELAAPVAFVEYKNGDRFGYVRFKDPREADNARNLFSRITIKQNNKNCKGKIFPFTRFTNGIQLSILKGKEEEEYWEWLKSEKDEQEAVAPPQETVPTKKEKPPKKKAVHLKFDEPEEPRKPRKRKNDSVESEGKKSKLET